MPLMSVRRDQVFPSVTWFVTPRGPVPAALLSCPQVWYLCPQPCLTIRCRKAFELLWQRRRQTDRELFWVFFFFSCIKLKKCSTLLYSWVQRYCWRPEIPVLGVTGALYLKYIRVIWMCAEHGLVLLFLELHFPFSVLCAFKSAYRKVSPYFLMPDGLILISCRDCVCVPCLFLSFTPKEMLTA